MTMAMWAMCCLMRSTILPDAIFSQIYMCALRLPEQYAYLEVMRFSWVVSLRYSWSDLCLNCLESAIGRLLNSALHELVKQVSVGLYYVGVYECTRTISSHRGVRTLRLAACALTPSKRCGVAHMHVDATLTSTAHLINLKSACRRAATRLPGL